VASVERGYACRDPGEVPNIGLAMQEANSLCAWCVASEKVSELDVPNLWICI